MLFQKDRNENTYKCIPYIPIPLIENVLAVNFKSDMQCCLLWNADKLENLNDYYRWAIGFFCGTPKSAPV